MPRFVVLSPVRTGGKTVKPSADPDKPAVIELSARDGRDLLALGAVEPAKETETPSPPKATTKRTASRKTSSRAAAEKAAAEKAANSDDTSEGQ